MKLGGESRKLHAHSVQYAEKLTSTRRAIEIKNTQHNSGALGLHAYTRSTSLRCPLPDCHHMDSTLHILSGFQCPVMRNM
eukprot:264268-Pelagomonas_calceolata.AAC.1